MPKAVGGESRIGFDQSSPIGMAIEILPEGVPAGFEVLSVQDADWQLDQPTAELSQSLTCKQLWAKRDEYVARLEAGEEPYSSKLYGVEWIPAN